MGPFRMIFLCEEIETHFCGITNPGPFFSSVAAMIITGHTLGGRILDTYSKEKIILIFPITSMVAMVILSFSRTLNMFILANCSGEQQAHSSIPL